MGNGRRKGKRRRGMERGREGGKRRDGGSRREGAHIEMKAPNQNPKYATDYRRQRTNVFLPQSVCLSGCPLAGLCEKFSSYLSGSL